ncbi:MAG: hypothetical protein ACQERZ_09755 [Fusobacteriota bacterium]
MKTNKTINISLVIIIILIIGLTIYLKSIHNYNKFHCNVDSDCTMSYTDKDYAFLCVNANWYAENKRDVGIQCGTKKTLYCLCENNECVRNDYGKGCD